MKKFLLGVAVAVVALLLIKYFTDKKEDKPEMPMAPGAGMGGMM